ncbi:hypothetical protein [Alteriqipengyuania lutimaris]|uniref:Uncharacterized protein n=1 Tax=Alteriqipengyuania lutimaris TaxID=1538146 RepID=A0A395LN50_9SPHN|nr:hypothetical protein [Alteriqipengyuania lutimaris]MBB3034135.1 hypothetical protein [Alteriqipengyuania lutimaris]RDS76934.1 hypothetical protein DL238_04470 [Alteriqipengyuania lutimaris]
MSYLEHSEFSPALGIQELTFEEVGSVNGALAPVGAYLVGKAIGYGVAAAAGTATGIAFTKAVKEIAKAID